MMTTTASTASLRSREDGKTYGIVDLLDTFAQGKTVITNVESYYKSHKDQCIYETDFNVIYDMLRDKEDCSQIIVFYDEIFSLLTAGKLNKETRNFLTQFRKRHLHFFTTCQLWSELPIAFRKLTRYEVSCNMFNVPLLGFAVIICEFNDGYEIKWDSESQEYVCPRLKTKIKKCSKRIADSYDTFEAIKVSGELTSR